MFPIYTSFFAVFGGGSGKQSSGALRYVNSLLSFSAFAAGKSVIFEFSKMILSAAAWLPCNDSKLATCPLMSIVDSNANATIPFSWMATAYSLLGSWFLGSLTM